MCPQCIFIATAFMGVLYGCKHLSISSLLVACPCVCWDPCHFIVNHLPCIFWPIFLGFRGMPMTCYASGWIFQPERCFWSNTSPPPSSSSNQFSECLDIAVRHAWYWYTCNDVCVQVILSMSFASGSWGIISNCFRGSSGLIDQRTRS